MRLKLMKLILKFFLSLFFLSCQATTEKSTIVRLALLDTTYTEMPLNFSLLGEYEKAYLAGVETATQVAKKYNINIIYEPFFYGNGPIDVLEQVPKVQSWNADFVIGPSSSDQFLMLRKYLPHIMVLSTYASDKTLQSLPKNFYSIFMSDPKLMQLLGKYIQKTYPNKNIYIIVQSDDKQSIDAANLFLVSYKTLSNSTKIIQNRIILDDINAINVADLLKGHESDIILIFNNTLYGYNQLVEHIATSMPKNHFIFSLMKIAGEKH